MPCGFEIAKLSSKVYHGTFSPDGGGLWLPRPPLLSFFWYAVRMPRAMVVCCCAIVPFGSATRVAAEKSIGETSAGVGAQVEAA
jgi:hypothetical protein